jgi:hypothetical protein
MLEAESPRAISSAGRIMSTTNFYDTIGNRTRDLSAGSALPKPTLLYNAVPFKNVGTVVLWNLSLTNAYQARSILEGYGLVRRFATGVVL